MIQTFSVPVAGRIANAAGRFFRYESAGSEGADQALRVRADGQDLGAYLPGDTIELDAAASNWELTPVSCSAVVKIGNGRIASARMTLGGTISLSQKGNASTSALKTVTSTSGPLLAAKPGRQYLLIQNDSLTGTVWIEETGAAVTGPATRIGPGGVYELDGSGWVPSGAINAIGDIASNPNVKVREA